MAHYNMLCMCNTGILHVNIAYCIYRCIQVCNQSASKSSSVPCSSLRRSKRSSHPHAWGGNSIHSHLSACGEKCIHVPRDREGEKRENGREEMTGRRAGNTKPGAEPGPGTAADHTLDNFKDFIVHVRQASETCGPMFSSVV